MEVSGLDLSSLTLLIIILCRALVWKTYVPPQILDSSLVSAIAQTFDWNFRRIYIEQPRVRLDGVYIAVCHYM